MTHPTAQSIGALHGARAPWLAGDRNGKRDRWTQGGTAAAAFGDGDGKGRAAAHRWSPSLFVAAIVVIYLICAVTIFADPSAPHADILALATP